MSLAAALSDAFVARPDPDAVPAASVAVAVDHQEVIQAWGVSQGTLFQAASISKPVAALVALRMAADGGLDLDADVNRFLTSWQLPGDAGAEPVTVRHVLCHGGGLSPSRCRNTARPGRPEAWRIYPEHTAAGLWCTPSDLLHFAHGVTARADRSAVP